MSRLDLGDRVLYPQGGFTRLIEVIAALAETHGARLHTGVDGHRGSSPTRARAGAGPASPGSSTSTATAPRTVDADVVVGRRRPAPHRDRAAARRRCRPTPSRRGSDRSPGPGAVLAMLGVEGRLPAAAAPLAVLHRGLGAELRRHLRHATHGCPTPRRSTSASRPRPTRPSRPEGCENLFVLVPVPADADHRRAAATTAPGPRPVERTADAAIDQIAAWAGVPDLRERILVRHTRRARRTSPRRYNAWRGGALGLEHTLRQSAFLRPGNVSRQGRRPALRRGEHRARRRPADVPDQRRARAQAPQRRPLRPAGAA